VNDVWRPVTEHSNSNDKCHPERVILREKRYQAIYRFRVHGCVLSASLSCLHSRSSRLVTSAKCDFQSFNSLIFLVFWQQTSALNVPDIQPLANLLIPTGLYRWGASSHHTLSSNNQCRRFTVPVKGTHRLRMKKGNTIKFSTLVPCQRPPFARVSVIDHRRFLPAHRLF